MYKEWFDQAGPNVRHESDERFREINSQLRPLEKYHPYNSNPSWPTWEKMTDSQRYKVLGFEHLITELCYNIQQYRKDAHMDLMETPFVYIKPILYDNSKLLNSKNKKIFKFAIDNWNQYIQKATNVSLILDYIPKTVTPTTIILPAGSQHNFTCLLHLNEELISEYYAYWIYA